MINPFSSIGNIGNLMKQAKGMQEKLKQVQEELAQAHFQGEAGGGLVQLTINGNGEAINIKIDDSVYKEDKQILQGLIVAAINDAQHKRDIKKKDMMSSMLGSLGLPQDLEI